jgi:hypothetical protein
MAMNGNQKYIDLLPEIEKEYNFHDIHSKIKMLPGKVTKKHEKFLLENVYKENNNRPIIKKPKFKIDQVVRISSAHRLFKRAYESNYSTELFRVLRINPKHPVTYHLCDYARQEEILGAFYETEMLATKNDDLFLIEKIIRRKKGKALVKFEGLGDEHNEWIDIKSIST